MSSYELGLKEIILKYQMNQLVLIFIIPSIACGNLYKFFLMFLFSYKQNFSDKDTIILIFMHSSSLLTVLNYYFKYVRMERMISIKKIKSFPLNKKNVLFANYSVTNKFEKKHQTFL